ncbi:MAG: hypothetical protein JOZ24_12315, partial [Candidatus Eremiobacteraeota bacterium]|nr:hypothetical protein [Candidatus Eremiobacteraeota bacterium]
DLQRSIVEQTPHVTAAAQTQYNAALQHAGTVIATGKSMLEAGTAGAQQHLQTFAEQARKTADSTASAVNAARQGGQASGDKGPGAGSGGTGSGSGTGTGSGGSSGRPPDATEAGGGGDVAEGEGNVPGSAAGTGSSDGT